MSSEFDRARIPASTLAHYNGSHGIRIHPLASRHSLDHPQLLVGLGDDAAVIRTTPERQLVVTSDLLTDGVDFRLQECDPRRVGRKAIAVNLSDLAAMAAVPLAVIVSVALPRRGAAELSRAIYEGIFELTRRYDVALAGGDTNTWDGGLVISVTALGETTAKGPVRRGGALPGDSILVTGPLGGSILGKHFDFEPRVREALLLHERYELHAGIDVSDGLSIDLARLAGESHCGAALDLQTVPISDDARQLAQQPDGGQTALEHALSDGEDFELILVVPRSQAERILLDQPLATHITCIGTMVPQLGLWSRASDGQLRPLEAHGYEHSE